mgnify:CR=1 FL=1
MRLEGTAVVCAPRECPLCQGRCIRVKDLGGPDQRMVACDHVVRATGENAEALGWTLHFVEAPAVVH